MVKTKKKKREKIKKEKKPEFPTLQLKTEREIALDFAQKVYQKFDKLIKSIILFGSIAKNTEVVGSDIDIVIIVDDAVVKFDQQLIVWYREELGKIIRANPYRRELHVNTVRLTTWWDDLLRGDPTVLNIIRYGDPIIDFGGFFSPLKILLEEGRIKITPEALYTLINRVPFHIRRSKISEMGAIEGCYWAMVDCAQALLMAVNVLPPSPEHLPKLLKEHFVDKGLLKLSYVTDMKELYDLHKKILHGEVKDIAGKIIDGWQNKTEEFFQVTLRLMNQLIPDQQNQSTDT